MISLSASAPKTASETPVNLVLPAWAAPFSEVLALLPQLSRYALVSALALALDVAVFLLLTRSEAARPALAGAIGYGIGLVLHYVLSVRLVFDATVSRKTRRRMFLEFVASGVLGLLITWAVIHVGVAMLGIAPLVAKAVAVIVSFVAVFLLRRSVVFAPAGMP